MPNTRAPYDPACNAACNIACRPANPFTAGRASFPFRTSEARNPIVLPRRTPVTKARGEIYSIMSQELKPSPLCALPITGPCSIANAVAAKVIRRSEVGFRKYGTTVGRTDLTFLQWIQHLQEELLDAAVYLERIKQEGVVATGKEKRR